MGLVRSAINFNIELSHAASLLLPQALRVDGNSWFQKNVLADSCRPGEAVYDYGGGSRPWVTAADRKRLGLRVVGVDISREELLAAPPESYDSIIVADLCNHTGINDGDVVICQALIEHVPDVSGVFRAITSTLKPGGRAYVFAPCRNALFAQINRLLPQELKRKILFSIHPSTAEGHDGFVAYYDRCVPSSIREIARVNGLAVEKCGTFWQSAYFHFFFPAYVFWRLYQLLAWIVIKDDACESFYLVLRKE